MFRDVIIEILICMGIYYIAWFWAMAAFVGQAIFSIYLLEYINYIRHYGLERKLGEKETEMHSWQTQMRLIRWTLLELCLHPAHHMKATVSFWQLQAYNHVNECPTRYYGLFWPCMVPCIWKSWVDPSIKKK